MNLEAHLRAHGVPCQPMLRYGTWEETPLYGVPILNSLGHVDFLLPILPRENLLRTFAQWYRFIALPELRIWPCGSLAFIGMFQVIK